MRCVLIGNYGVGNLGDEALWQYFIRAFPEVHWDIVSGEERSPALPRLPTGPRSLFRPWPRTLSAIRLANAVVFGGGTLFTDSESWRAPVLWWLHAAAAAFFGTPIVLAFQGIGPVRSRVGVWCTQWVLRRAAFISVRDAASYDRVRQLIPELSNSNIKCIQTFDPAFIAFKGTRHDSTKKLIIIPRANSSPSFISQAIAHANQGWQDIVILLLDPVPDQPIAQMLQASVLGARIVAATSVDILRDEVCSASMVLTQRYHGAIASIANDVAFRAIPQKPGDKLDEVNKARREDCQKLVERGENALRQFLAGVS